MLVGLAAVALVGLGFLITWLATRNSGDTPQAQTIVLTTTRAAQTSTGATTTKQTTTRQTTQPATTTADAPRLPATATVPSLSGTEEEAADALSHAGLLTSLVFVPSSDSLGTVEGQGRAAGTTAPYHAHVQVNIATGPGQKPSETVPDVIGKKLPQAVAAANAAGLRLIYVRYPVTSKSQAGTIVQQSPLAGEHAPKNAQVLVYMAAVEG
jgi:beta-lactam-binding protein with PASTA domain